MTLYDGSGSFEGDFAVYLSAPSGSFGVYQEMCVEAGVPVHVEWAWKGQAPGTGWWEVLIVDAAYSYDAVDNPAGHPETFLASKWEKGFPNPKYPEPSAAWASGSAEVTPTSDVITVVLKCGSTEGGIVEAWFDAVTVGFDTQVLEVTSVTPAIGKAAGGDAILVTGRVFPEGATVTLGGAPLVDAIRWSTCEIRGATPPGEGAVDVVVTAPGGSATVPGGFRYVPPPTVSAVDPSSGPPAGGTDVTIRGAGFVGVAPGDVAVRIGGTALLETAVVDEGTITGKTPAGGAGPADVTVTTPFGEVTLAGGFTYVEAGVRFVRGDCDSDGELNITDGIAVLGFLFLGGNEPPCLEACNPDDGPELNILGRDRDPELPVPRRLGPGATLPGLRGRLDRGADLPGRPPGVRVRTDSARDVHGFEVAAGAAPEAFSSAGTSPWKTVARTIVPASRITSGTSQIFRQWNLPAAENLSITIPANCEPRKSPTPVVAAKIRACIELRMASGATRAAKTWPTIMNMT